LDLINHINLIKFEIVVVIMIINKMLKFIIQIIIYHKYENKVQIHINELTILLVIFKNIQHYWVALVHAILITLLTLINFLKYIIAYLLNNKQININIIV